MSLKQYKKRARSKATTDYKFMTLKSANVAPKCSICGDKIKQGERYYYKIGDEIHEICPYMQPLPMKAKVK